MTTPSLARQRGLSLVEIMVALVLSLFLLGAVINVFLGSKQTYRTSDAIGRLQENGRFALEAIARDLRLAGHIGCADPKPGSGTEIKNTAGLSYTLPDDAIAGTDGPTDSITLRYGAAASSTLAADMTSRTDTITLAGVPNVRGGNVALIVDPLCQSGEVFTVTDMDMNAHTVAHDGLTLPPYGAGSQLMSLTANQYTVKETTRSNQAGAPILALYRNGEELVEGVENLQIQYGERVGGNVRYVDWSAALDTEELVSIRVGLLVSSIDPVMDGDDQATYDVAGVDVPPTATGVAGPQHAVDRRLRRVFSTTVDLRNRRGMTQ